MTIIARFLKWWPLVWKSTMEDAVKEWGDELIEGQKRSLDIQEAEYKKREAHLEQRLKRQSEAHAEELEKQGQAIDAILKRGSQVEWDRTKGDTYRMTLSFDARMLAYGRYDQHELDFLAKRFGWEVEREVRRCKFIESARNREYTVPHWRELSG